MNATSHTRRQPHILMPLVRSIGNELSERIPAIRLLEQRILTAPRKSLKRETLIAEAKVHRRAIMNAQDELERLDCSVLSDDPVTLGIRPHDGSLPDNVLWQARAES